MLGEIRFAAVELSTDLHLTLGGQRDLGVATFHSPTPS